MARRWIAITVAAIAAIGVSSVRRSTTVEARHSQNAMAIAARNDRRELDRLIRVYEHEAEVTPTSAGLTFLTQMYLQRGRSTGDVRTYQQAAEAAEKALALAPRDHDIKTLLAGIRYTTHEFAAANEAAAALVAERPTDLAALAVLGDSQMELGRYADARTTYRQLGEASPDAAAVLVRRARLAFIQGDIYGARQYAADAKGKADESAFADAGLAFYSVFQGQVEFDSGRYDQAAKFYQRALDESPGFYSATAGMARSRAAQGRTADAIALYEQAIAVVPQPDFLAALGDLYQVTGNTAKAADQYATVEVIATLAAINKQVYNRQLALYYADHDVKISEAVRLADAELAVRHDVYGYDTLAWALYKNGDYHKAADAARQALSQHTPDARIWYHAGLIDKALGNTTTASDELQHALDLNPSFDPLQAPLARAALDQLKGKTS
jgi:tetratricopeptide (TPR) repeat protein